mmetsp:Transcript_6998/g.16003  ORF Transcript_6998/g.16003 Transcript_6998/m.16003 type:complete len:213 (-) Transcript_6998:177-815(-)
MRDATKCIALVSCARSPKLSGTSDASAVLSATSVRAASSHGGGTDVNGTANGYERAQLPRFTSRASPTTSTTKRARLPTRACGITTAPPKMEELVAAGTAGAASSIAATSADSVDVTVSCQTSVASSASASRDVTADVAVDAATDVHGPSPEHARSATVSRSGRRWTGIAPTVRCSDHCVPRRHHRGALVLGTTRWKGRNASSSISSSTLPP